MQVKNSSSTFIYLGFITLITVGIATLVYLNWFELVTTSQQWQRTFHSSLKTFLLKVKSDPLNTGVLLIGLSFLYGILHSAGPGHGKVIITTYLATQPSQLKKSLLLTLFSAIMQGIVAIGLVSVFLILLNLSPKKITLSEYWLELASYIMVILIGLFICYRTIRKIVKSTQNKTSTQLKIQAIRPASPNIKVNAINKLATNSQLSSSLSCECCGHRHLPTTQEITKSTHWYTDLAIIISIGLRPCSGAILILIFAYVIGVYIWGIAATIAMSLGTAITTSLFALFVYFARKTAASLVQNNHKNFYFVLSWIGQFIALVGGILFIVMGLILFMGTEQSLAVNPLLGFQK